jgi:predicted ATPase/DNA-binding XRE family transcriptional regulator
VEEAATDAVETSPFGELLRQHRLAAGLTQEALAERAGLAERTIQDLERGVARPRRETLRRLVVALTPAPAARAHFEQASLAPRRRAGRTAQGQDGGRPGGRTAGRSGGVSGSESSDSPDPVPAALTSFVGRERELEELQQLLQTCRLLTLTGAGGCGKTRLALELVRRVAPRFPDGCYLVSLAPLADPDLVATTIVATLGIRETPGRSPTESLRAGIGERCLLLVLDNFEHLLAAAPLLIALLTACRRLVVLVTSREVLRLGGEQLYPVPPLQVPEQESVRVGGGDFVSRLAETEAVRLFVDRARSARPDFRLDNENATVIAEICARLDGLPLAIELAAARIRLLSPEAILKRLERRLPLLTGGARDLPARQQTLRDTLAWSYDLLDRTEQGLFRRLGIFAGGWTLEAAEAICDPNGELGLEVLDGLDSLVAKSLVVQQERSNGEPRFGMLETIREYALEQLEASGEKDAVRRRQAEFFLGFGEEAESGLRVAEQGEWLARLEQEHDNLRAALAWSHARAETSEVALRLAGTLAWFWYVHGHFAEGRPWLDRTLARSDGTSAAVRAKALAGAGLLALRQADYEQASVLLEEGLTLYQATGDAWGLGWCYSLMAMVARERGDYERATVQFEESARFFRVTGDAWGIGWAIGSHGLMATRLGEYDRAVALLEESHQAHQRLGNRLGVARGLAFLGLVEQGRGNQARAESLLDESLILLRDLSDSWGMAQALDGLGRLALDRGDGRRSEALHQESLRLYRDIGHKVGISGCLDDLAVVAVALREGERAVRLLAAAEAIRSAIGASLPSPRLVVRERTIASARAMLGEQAFAAAWAEGQAMSLERAVEYALNEVAAAGKRSSSLGG